MTHAKLDKDNEYFSSASAWQLFFLGFFFIVLFEMFGVSLFLFSRNKTIALIHLGLSVLTLVWIPYSYRKIRANPSILDDQQLQVKAGLSLNFSIPLNEILSVELKSPITEMPAECLNLVPLAEPEIILNFKNNIHIPGRFGRKRSSAKVGLTFDDSSLFVRSLNSRLQQFKDRAN